MVRLLSTRVGFGLTLKCQIRLNILAYFAAPAVMKKSYFNIDTWPRDPDIPVMADMF